MWKHFTSSLKWSIKTSSLLEGYQVASRLSTLRRLEWVSFESRQIWPNSQKLSKYKVNFMYVFFFTSQHCFSSSPLFFPKVLLYVFQLTKVFFQALVIIISGLNRRWVGLLCPNSYSFKRGKQLFESKPLEWQPELLAHRDYLRNSLFETCSVWQEITKSRRADVFRTTSSCLSWFFEFVWPRF